MALNLKVVITINGQILVSSNNTLFSILDLFFKRPIFSAYFPMIIFEERF